MLTVESANAILEKYGLWENAIGEAIASGLGRWMPRKKCDRLDWIFRPAPEACGARREIRVECDWGDGEEAHEVSVRLRYRFSPTRKWREMR